MKKTIGCLFFMMIFAFWLAGSTHASFLVGTGSILDSSKNVNAIIDNYNLSYDPDLADAVNRRTSEDLSPPSTFPSTVTFTGSDKTSGVISWSVPISYLTTKYDGLFSVYYVAGESSLTFSGYRYDLNHWTLWDASSNNGVPIPAPVLLLASGFLGFVAFRRYRFADTG